MRKGHRRLHHNTAVSEIIGTVLLLGISVTLFSVVYVSVLSVQTSPSIASANIICTIVNGDLVFSHIGGSELPENTKILLKIPGEDQILIMVNDHMSTEAISDGKWGIGEQVRYSNSSYLGKEIDYSIIDADANAIVVAGLVPAVNPIRTFINDILTCTGSFIQLTASSTGTEPDNVTLWYRWSGYWEDTFDNGDDFVSSYQNMTFNSGYVEVNKSGEGTDILYYVDNKNVAIDGENDFGTHSDFTQEQSGPDGLFDILTELDNGTIKDFLDDGFEGNPWNDNWNDVTSNWILSDTHHSGSYSACSQNNNEGYFISNEFNTSGVSAIYIDFWYRLQNTEDSDLLIQYFNGIGWYSHELGSGSQGTWRHYTQLLTDSNFFISDFKIRFYSNLGNNERVWVDDVSVSGLTTIISETFEGNFPPSGWTVTNIGASGTCVWERNDDYARSNYAGTGYCADADADECGYGSPWPMDTQLITPSIDLSDSNLSFIEFNMYFKDYNYGADFAEIQVSTDGGSSWSSIQRWYDDHSGYEIIDLSAYNGISDIKIAFRYYSNGWNYYFEVDDVNIFKQIPDKINYCLDLQINWENIEYTSPNEYLCIRTGDFSGEIIYIDIWNETGNSWENQKMQLNENAWNNISVSDWLTSSTFTIRYRAADETGDTSQDTWEIDVALLHLWEPGGTIFYEGNITSEPITKPSDADWSRFYVDVDNTGGSTFKILSSSGDTILSDLSNGDSISTVSDDSIYLYGIFNDSVKLYSWKITVEDSPWLEGDTDTSSDWSWEFYHPDPTTKLVRNFYFYSIGKKVGWPSEDPPSSPGFDTSCVYEV